MIKILKFIFMLFLLNSNIAFSNSFDVVAKIDHKIITNHDLDNYSQILNTYFKTDNSKKSKKEIRKEVLNSVIDTMLRKKAVAEANIAFDEVEFGYFVENFENQNKVSASNGINREVFLDVMRTNFLWLKLVENNIKPSITINSPEVYDSLEYLSENSIQTIYNISQILVYNQENSSEVANKLYSEIKNNNNFEDIAQKFSQDEAGKKNKGHVGWVNGGDINKNIYDVLKGLNVGETSKPILIDNGSSSFFILVKLNDKKEEKIAKQDDIQRVQYYIYSQKLNSQIKKYLEDLYNRSFVEIYI